jgi:hypothetical protein
MTKFILLYIVYFIFTSNSKTKSKKMSDNKMNETNVNSDEPNPIDLIAEEIDADRIHLDSLRLDKRMSAKDYEFITRLPLSAKQLINILYELYPVKTPKKECESVCSN